MYFPFINHSPKVSVVTVVLNRAAQVAQTIESVLSQSYPNIEYIIVDGGSTDGTLDVIQKYRKHIKRMVSGKDNGISDAFNKGVLMSSGDLVGLINSDDWYEQDAVAAIVDEYRKYPFYDVFYGKCRLGAGGDSMIPSWNEHIGLKDYMSIAHPSSFVTKRAFVKYGLFDLNIQIAMDYDWFLRAYVMGALYKFVDKKIATHRIGGVSWRRHDEALVECKMSRSKYLSTL